MLNFSTGYVDSIQGWGPITWGSHKGFTGCVAMDAGSEQGLVHRGKLWFDGRPDHTED